MNQELLNVGLTQQLSLTSERTDLWGKSPDQMPKAPQIKEHTSTPRSHQVSERLSHFNLWGIRFWPIVCIIITTAEGWSRDWPLIWEVSPKAKLHLHLCLHHCLRHTCASFDLVLHLAVTLERHLKQGWVSQYNFPRCLMKLWYNYIGLCPSQNYVGQIWFGCSKQFFFMEDFRV